MIILLALEVAFPCLKLKIALAKIQENWRNNLRAFLSNNLPRMMHLSFLIIELEGMRRDTSNHLLDHRDLLI